MTNPQARRRSIDRHQPAAVSRSPLAVDAVALQQDVSIGLYAVTEFNQSIRYADTKAGALAALQALATTVLAAKRDAELNNLGATLLFLGCLVAVVISATLLAAGQSPRLFSGRRPESASRIAFPSLAAMQETEVLRAPPLKSQHEQVWRQASELAVIAMTKYRWLRRAMISTLGTLAAVLLWLAVTTWLTQC
jgi:hypothetical protein